MKNLFLLIFFLTSSFLFAQKSAYPDFFAITNEVYVDFDASDGGAGTEPDPFNELSDITWTEGTMAFLKRGTSHTYGVSGVPGHYYIGADNCAIGAYGTGDRPVLNYQASGGESWAIAAVNRNNILVRDIVCHSPGGHGIRFHSTGAAKIIHVKIENSNIGFSVWRNNSTADVFVDSCEISEIQTEAIWCNSQSGGNLYVTNNKVYRFNLSNGEGDGIQTVGFGYNYIANNTIDKSTATGKFCIVTEGAEKVVIEDNILFGPVSGDGSVMYLNPTDSSIIRRNYIKGGQRGIWVNTGYHQISYNIVKGTYLAAGIHLRGSGKVYNNVISGCVYGIYDEASGDFIVENNVLDNNTTQLQNFTSSDTINYNCYWPGSLPSLAGSNAINSDPLFVTADTLFHIQAGSPLIDKGDYMQDGYDYFYMPVKSNPDIGVHEYNAVVVNATGVTVAPATANIALGYTKQLEVQVLPSGASYKTVVWKSDNPNVAIVNLNGLVTALSEGTAYITATTTDGGFMDTCIVTAERVPVTGIDIPSDSISIIKGNEQQLSTVITPSNATNQNITWSSDNPSIASVSEEGLVEGLETGETIVRVIAEDGGIVDSCIVIIEISEWSDIMLENPSFELPDDNQSYDSIEAIPGWYDDNPVTKTLERDLTDKAKDGKYAGVLAVLNDGSTFGTLYTPVDYVIPDEGITLRLSWEQRNAWMNTGPMEVTAYIGVYDTDIKSREYVDSLVTSISKTSDFWTKNSFEVYIDGITYGGKKLMIGMDATAPNGSWVYVDDFVLEQKSISSDPFILISGKFTEGQEDGEIISIIVKNDTLVQGLDIANWNIENLPTGVTVNALTRVNDSLATISLSGNATVDYDENITNTAITVSAAEFKTSEKDLSADKGVVFQAIVEPPSFTMESDGEILEGSEDGEIIMVYLDGDQFSRVVTAQYFIGENLPEGVSIKSAQKIDDVTAKVTLSGNSTVDYDEDIHLILKISATQLVNSENDLTANKGVVFTAGKTGLSGPEYNGISVYPNPVGDVLNITHNTEIVSYKLYSATGQLIKGGPVSANNLKINTSALKKGLYILTITDKANNVYPVKVTK